MGQEESSSDSIITTVLLQHLPFPFHQPHNSISGWWSFINLQQEEALALSVPCIRYFCACIHILHLSCGLFSMMLERKASRVAAQIDSSV